MKFNIPITEQAKVIKLLDEYNLHAFSLFDSEDALMETLAIRAFDIKRYGLLFSEHDNSPSLHPDQSTAENN